MKSCSISLINTRRKVRNDMQDSIRQITTNLRALAYEIGGSHHTPKESEELLMNFADRLDDIGYELITESRRFETISGVSRKGYELYLRQKNIEELKRRKESEVEE